jgi:hypothetical protein
MRFQLVCAQQLVWFRYGKLTMHPFRFHRIKLRILAGQRADGDAHPDLAPLDLLSVLTEPVPHSVAPVPGGFSSSSVMRCSLGPRAGPSTTSDHQW